MGARGGGRFGGIHDVNVALTFSHLIKLFSTSAPCPMATSGTISQGDFNTKFLLDK